MFFFRVSQVIELKAELLRKQEQFEREKTSGQREPVKVCPLPYEL